MFSFRDFELERFSIISLSFAVKLEAGRKYDIKTKLSKLEIFFRRFVYPRSCIWKQDVIFDSPFFLQDVLNPSESNTI